MLATVNPMTNGTGLAGAFENRADPAGSKRNSNAGDIAALWSEGRETGSISLIFPGKHSQQSDGIAAGNVVV
jgi:hypothetical protein